MPEFDFTSAANKHLGGKRTKTGQTEQFDQEQKKITSSDMNGVMTWTLPRTADSKQFEIEHNLGQIPRGFWVTGGRTPMRVWRSYETDWTKDKMYVYVEPWVRIQALTGGIASGSASNNFNLLRDVPYQAGSVAFEFSIMNGQSDATTLTANGFKASLRDDRGAGLVAVSEPPYTDAFVSTMDGQNVGSATISLQVHVMVNPQKGEKYELQVY